MSSSNIPTFVMMCGLPGSGKSSYAAQLAPDIDAEIFSSDEIRIELYGDIRYQNHNAEVFDELHKRVKNCLKSGKSAIYDATNVSARRRKSFIRELGNIECVKVCLVVATRYETCLEMIEKRQENGDPSVCGDVPRYVVARMRSSWNTPHNFEGWDIVDIVYPHGEDGMYKSGDWISRAASFDQHNPYHTQTLGNHCLGVYRYLIDKHWNDQTLCAAGLLHDVGKEHTQTFFDSKGNESDVAHYYNHENVGAYESLFYQFDTADALDVSVLINLHMKPYGWEKSPNTEKLQEKYKRTWGDKLFNQVMKLHNADMSSH